MSVGRPRFNRVHRALAIGALVVVVAVLLFLTLSGRLALYTQAVNLTKWEPAGSGGTMYWTASFRRTVMNPAPGEAEFGAARVLIAPGAFMEKNPELLIALTHAENTGIKSLTLTLTAPPEWGEWLFVIPDGDGWGPLTYRRNGGKLTLTFAHLGWDSAGYRGSIALTFEPAATAYVQENGWAGSLGVDVDFTMAPLVFPRFRQWHVHGSWQMPRPVEPVPGG